MKLKFAAFAFLCCACGALPGGDDHRNPHSASRSAYNGIRCQFNYQNPDLSRLQGITIQDNNALPAERNRHLTELSHLPGVFHDIMRRYRMGIFLTAKSITDFL